MKTRITQFSILAFLGLLTLSSYSGGVAGNGNEGNTGAPGDVVSGSTKVTCQFCHSSGAFGPPNMKIELYDSIGTTKLMTYLPGQVHTIRMSMTTTGAPMGFGFQMIDIKKINNAPVAGFLAQSAQLPSIQIATTSAQSPTPNRTYAEHRGVSTSPIFNIKWRAPVRGGGSIVFYAAGNAVNRNGNQNGDGSTSTNQEFAEGTTATKEATDITHFEVFNTGHSEEVTLSLTSQKARSVSVRVSNLAGQIVATDKWNIASGDNIRSLNLGNARGAYLIQIIDNQSVITKKIIKF
jgi:hypothetical protein